MEDLLFGFGIGVLTLLFVMFLAYSIGLSMVFKKFGERRWRAFIPIYNFATLIKVLHLPKRWAAYALIPYAGTIYSMVVAQRLGKSFGKKTSFSLIWLTYGATIGMPMMGFSKSKPNLKVIDEPTPDLKEFKEYIKSIAKHREKTTK